MNLPSDPIAASPFGSPRFRDPKRRVVLQIGLMSTLYFQRGLSAETRLRVRDCLNLYLKAAGPHLRWMTTPTGNAWERFTPEQAAAYLRLLESPAPGTWEMHWHGGRRRDEASEFQFEVFAEDRPIAPLSFLRFALPLSWLDTPAGPYPQLVQRFCQILQPYHGYGGLAFLESGDLEVKDLAQPLVRSLARRFPGIEVDRPLESLFTVNEGIKGVNWLTVLGQRWVKAMGGVTALRAALPGAFVFLDFGDGIIIQAGPRPQMGDRNQKLWLTLYPELARLLKPIRVTKHGCFDNAGPDRFTPETTWEWLTRFDRDPW